jgi:hypothetical protein|eukprot:COSAG06_NODE_118_length_23136_cov_18.029257_3_plen_435_part_00
MRFARKLPTASSQENRYNEEWVRITESEVNPDALHKVRRENLVLGKHPVDRHFEENVLFYRRIRQLADPEYAMSTAARQKLRGRLCPGGFDAERDFARQKIAGTDHAVPGAAIIERIWLGELSLDELQAHIAPHDDLQRPGDMQRLAELILHADEDEFDDDVKVADRLHTCDQSRSEEFFRDELVKFRRIRQLTFPERAMHQSPSFQGETPEEEKDEVRRINLPQWERRGWDLTQAVEQMWSGEFRLKALAADADADATYVIKKMLDADSAEYAAAAKNTHRQNTGGVSEEKMPEVAELMATLATRPVGGGSLAYERRTTETDLFPALEGIRPELGDAVLRIWAGERDQESLTAGRPPVTQSFIAEILSKLEGGGGVGFGGVGRGGGGGARPGAVPEDIASLMGFTGKSEGEVKMCLEAAGGDREAAAAMLLGA